MPSDVLLGCSGWGYDDWKGGFYPTSAPPSEYLARYARVFRVAEIDTTYYAIPKRELVERWARQTPPGFVFTPKLPGAITHEAKTRGADGLVARFLETLEPLRAPGKLGPLLAQFPASFRAERDGDALRAFVRGFPKGFDLAVELRHDSWWTDATLDALRERRAALVWSIQPHATIPPVITAPFLYTRLIGDRALTRFDRVQRDLTPEIEGLAKRLEAPMSASMRIYVIANNHFMGFAPATAQRVAAALGADMPDITAASRTSGQRALGEF